MALPSGTDSTVFVGVVQSTPLMDWLRLLFRYRVVTFDVIEGLSGLSGREVSVETGMGGGDCGDGFQPGCTYLVFAVRTPSGAWTTNICMRNRLLMDVPNDLVFLRDWMQRGARGHSLSGILSETPTAEAPYAPPMEFTKIVATGGGKTFIARTNMWGWFQIDGLPESGVTLSLNRPGWHVRQPTEKIIFKGKGCLNVDIVASPD